MPDNPFRASCFVAGCKQPVAVRGRCAAHAGQQDQARGLSSDRHHAHLYASARWKRLRLRILRTRLFCECPDCKGVWPCEPTQVVHHREPHGGREELFFAETNLQALSKVCHDKLTGHSKRPGYKQNLSNWARFRTFNRRPMGASSVTSSTELQTGASSSSRLWLSARRGVGRSRTVIGKRGRP